MFTVKVIPISITKNCIMTEEPINNLYILVFIAITIFGRLVSGCWPFMHVRKFVFFRFAKKAE